MSVNLAENDFYKDFSGCFGERILFNVEASQFTTLKTGGSILAVVFPENEAEIGCALELCREWNLKFLPLGKGSNVLFSDKGFNGVVINLSGKFNRFSVKEEEYGNCSAAAQGGAFLPAMVKFFSEMEIGGIEWAWGIPGTIAGAVSGNAGAFGSSVMEYVDTIRVLGKDGNAAEIRGSKIDREYRFSGIDAESVIAEVILKLHKINGEEGRKKIAEYREKRMLTQPSSFFTAGSVFKNPEDIPAGKLIDECGFKGKKRGGAAISEKHANFIVNTGNATSADILDLMREVREGVHRKKGIMLYPEIKIIGEVF